MSYYDYNNKNIFGGDLDEPLPNKSFGQLLYESLVNAEDKVALVDGNTGNTLTYRNLLEQSRTLTKAFKALNLQKGESISIFSENSIYFPIPILASMFMGVTVAPVNFSYIKDELVHCLSITKPRVVFTSLTNLKRLLEVRSQCQFIEKVIVFDDNVSRTPLIETYGHLINRFSEDSLNDFKIDQTIVPEKDVAMVFCSSGTTGLPKGVMITHRNYVCSYSISRKEFVGFDFRPTDIQLMFLPLFHAYGCSVVLYNLALTAKVILMNKFSLEQYLSLIDKYRVTMLCMVPPVCVQLAKSDDLVKKYNLESVRQIICGAAPLSKELEAAVLKKFNVPNIFQGYGMTETTLSVTYSNKDTKFGSIGKLVQGMYAKIIDPDTGESLGPNTNGELCFKGPLIMKGYCGNPQATAHTIDPDGWLHTGDVGYYDDDLYFYIVDRLKELIKYKGFQTVLYGCEESVLGKSESDKLEAFEMWGYRRMMKIKWVDKISNDKVAPAELEALLLENEHVKDVGVVGTPDELAGELPTAFVVRQPNSNITSVEIVNFVKDRVSPQKRLHGGVIFIDEIPKNPSGKILRRKLRELVTKRKAHL